MKRKTSPLKRPRLIPVIFPGDRAGTSEGCWDAEGHHMARHPQTERRWESSSQLSHVAPSNLLDEIILRLEIDAETVAGIC